MKPVDLYITLTCSWCKKTKEWLKERKIKFTEHNVVDDLKACEAMIKKSMQGGFQCWILTAQFLLGFN